jgi:hypothetical protein
VRALVILRQQSVPALSAARCAPSKVFPLGGHACLAAPGDSQAVALLSLRKGGVLSIRLADGSLWSDFGVAIQQGGTRLVSHWWSDLWQSHSDAASAEVEGPLFACRDRQSTPLKHMLLRVLSFALGRRLIGLLKRVMIFRRPPSAQRFRRHVVLHAHYAVIRDRISALRPDDVVEFAPRASKRHVASADSFHPEDFAAVSSHSLVHREWQIVGDTWSATTTVHYSSASETSSS